MSKLLVEKLESTLTQSITLSNEHRYNIASIAPYIYMHGAPSGTFTLSVKVGSETYASDTFTCAEIKTGLGTANNYAHVFFPLFDSQSVVIHPGDYDVVLSASGYTATASSFIGWIRQHEDLNNDLSYTASADSDNPLAMRVKVYRRY